MGPRRKIAVPFNFQHDQTDNDSFWNKITRKSVYASPKKLNYRELMKSRATYKSNKLRKFRTNFKRKNRQSGSNEHFRNIVTSLKHWVRYSSWTFCRKCKLLSTNKLVPSALRNKGCRPSLLSKCWCQKSNYVVPSYKKVPKALRKLTKDDDALLRIFDFDIGAKKMAAAGHRIKSGAFELRVRSESVQARIEGVRDPQRKARLIRAFKYLSESRKSHYSKFLSVAKQLPAESKIKFWVVYNKMPGIECALWPCLYPFSSWCESLLPGTKDSILHAFRIKLLSNIIDYNNFEILQFHYDRWQFKTITGALNSGKFRNCSPLRSLDDKHFTAGYWNWQHRYLIDAALQFGHPTLFLTISPSEFDFPKAIWLSDYLEQSGAVPTKCGPVETIHIAHILDSFCRGYITGCNSSTWESHDLRHVLYARKHQKLGNVKCCFYRYEYQKRRTIHVHMLVWLESCTELDLNRLKATIPLIDVDEAFLVQSLQSSDKPSPFLDVCSTSSADADQIFLEHSQHDKDLNIRAYVDVVLHVLQSSMDVQTSDGESALMRYVTSYVSKLAENATLLRNTSANVFQQLWPFMVDMQPGEPEMAMAFSSTKLSYCSLTRVRFTPPTEEFVSESALIQRYMKRAIVDEQLTLLEYMRTYNTNKVDPSMASNIQLVGVYYKYIFNPRFFWEYTLLNTPFRRISDLKDPLFDVLPASIKTFSYLLLNHKEFLKSPELFLSALGYPQYKLDEFKRICRGYEMLYYKTSVTSGTEEAEYISASLNELDLQQTVAYNHVESSISDHLQYKENLSFSHSESSSLSSSLESLSSHSEEDVSGEEAQSSSSSSSCDESNCAASISDYIGDDFSQCTIRPTLISGVPGSGKSFITIKLVNMCIEKGLDVLFAFATAKMARDCLLYYNSPFVSSDTIHSLFKIPTDDEFSPSMNWGLLKYSLVIIDECGMVRDVHMEHCIASLDSLPVPVPLLLVGDPLQQLPLQTTDSGGTALSKNIFHNSQLMSLCNKFTLTKTHRFDDPYLESILGIMRTSFLSKHQMQILNEQALSDKVDDNVIVDALERFPLSTFLCGTKRCCNIVNDSIISHIFQPSEMVATVTNAEYNSQDIYLGLKIVITENLVKEHNVVNGMSCSILSFDHDIILIELPNRSIHFLHARLNEDNVIYYPFLPNYSTTIFKAQGKNLQEVTVWLDDDFSAPGQAYVAFSRVPRFSNIHLLQRVKCRQIIPIKYASPLQDN